jgi:hypothetical protein
MKVLACAAFALLFCSTVSDAKGVRVRGYTTRRGTYVMPAMRTSPNRTRTDNWSSRPNVNPYTGRVGTRNPYAPKPYRSHRY